MPFRIPYFNFPSFFNKPFPYNMHNPLKSSLKDIPKVNSGVFNNNYLEEKKYSEKKNDSNSSTEYFFELFGIHLYFDDILLICLLFFLYGENVKDDGLFICLILLLLTS